MSNEDTTKISTASNGEMYKRMLDACAAEHGTDVDRMTGEDCAKLALSVIRMLATLVASGQHDSEHGLKQMLSLSSTHGWVPLSVWSVETFNDEVKYCLNSRTTAYITENSLSPGQVPFATLRYNDAPPTTVGDMAGTPFVHPMPDNKN